jgi:hypothetical protein
MAHLADNKHNLARVNPARANLARVNSAVMLGVIGGGLAVCVLGAAIYDLERLFSSW